MNLNFLKRKKVFSILLFALFFQFVFVLGTMAADTGEIDFKPQVEIPELQITSVGGDFVALKTYISAVYRVAMGITGILAVIVLALGGITWLTSGGNATQIGKAKQYIWGSMTGLILALLSYTLLYTVNPDIVNLKTGGSVTSLANADCHWEKNGCGIESVANEGKCGGSTGHKGESCCCIAPEGCCMEILNTTIQKCSYTTAKYCDIESPFPHVFNYFAQKTCDQVPECVSAGMGSDCKLNDFGKPCGVNKFCYGGECAVCYPEGLACVIKEDRCCLGYHCEDTLFTFNGNGVCKPNN